MYRLSFTNTFFRSSRKLTKKNPSLKDQIGRVVGLLRQDPFYPGLRSHKVNSKSYGEVQSSWVNGDLRILWIFKKMKRKFYKF